MAILIAATDEISLNGNSLQIFPNPASDKFQLVNMTHQNGVYSIADLSGKIIKSGTTDQDESVFIGDLSEGNYLFKFISDENTVSILKLIKK